MTEEYISSFLTVYHITKRENEEKMTLKKIEKLVHI